MSRALLIPVAAPSADDTQKAAYAVQSLMDKGKTLDEAIKVVNDGFNGGSSQTFGHTDGFVGNSAVAFIPGLKAHGFPQIVVFRQLDSRKHPLKPGKWSFAGSKMTAQATRWITTEMTDDVNGLVKPVMTFINRQIKKRNQYNSSITCAASSGGSNATSSASASATDIDAQLEALMKPAKGKGNSRK